MLLDNDCISKMVLFLMVFRAEYMWIDPEVLPCLVIFQYSS